MLDSGAGGHVMLEGMFPRVKLERKTAPNNFVAANGEQFRALCAETISLKGTEGGSQMHHIQECERCQSSYLNAARRPSWKHSGAG